MSLHGANRARGTGLADNLHRHFCPAIERGFFIFRRFQCLILFIEPRPILRQTRSHRTSCDISAMPFAKMLRDRSKPFCDPAHQILEPTHRNPERTVALRNVFEAEDAALRAGLNNHRQTSRSFALILL